MEYFPGPIKNIIKNPTKKSNAFSQVPKGMSEWTSTIAKNIVIIGNRDVSIAMSDNQVICTESSEFNYENIDMTHCFEWERVHMLGPGYYLINLIIEQKVALQTTLKLK